MDKCIYCKIKQTEKRATEKLIPSLSCVCAHVCRHTHSKLSVPLMLNRGVLHSESQYRENDSLMTACNNMILIAHH